MHGTETAKRYVAMSLTWRALGLLILGGTAYVVTGDPVVSLVLTLVFNGIRVALYPIHQFLWDRYIAWGRNGCPNCGWPHQKDET